MAFTYVGLVCFTLLYCAIAAAILIRARSSYSLAAGLIPDDRASLRLLKRRGALYLLVFFFCWSWYVVYFSVLYVHKNYDADDDTWYALSFITAFMLPLSGFLNSIVFSWGSGLRMRMAMHARQVSAWIINIGARCCCMCCPTIRETTIKKFGLAPASLVLGSGDTYYSLDTGPETDPYQEGTVDLFY